MCIRDRDYIHHWKELNIDFDCIYSGFLGSERQIEIVSGFIDDFGTEDNMVAVSYTHLLWILWMHARQMNGL